MGYRVFGCAYGPGEYVGEMGLDGGVRSASVVALETTVCSMVTRRTLEQHLREQPEFAFELIAKVIRRARAATMSAKSMALNDVYGRLKQLRQLCAWRSTHDTLALSVPPTNHFTPGLFASVGNAPSSTCFHGVAQCSSLATSAQNASGSRAARSYSAS